MDSVHFGVSHTGIWCAGKIVFVCCLLTLFAILWGIGITKLPKSLNMTSRSHNAIEKGVIRQNTYDFLLAFHSSYVHMLYRLRDI